MQLIACITPMIWGVLLVAETVSDELCLENTSKIELRFIFDWKGEKETGNENSNYISVYLYSEKEC